MAEEQKKASDWADEAEKELGAGAAEEEEAAPPGFEGVKPTPEADELAQKLAGEANVSEPGAAAADEPDLALGKAEELKEETAEIKTVTDENNIYAAASAFEDLGLSESLLQGLYTEMKFEKPSRIQASTLPMILRPDANGVYRSMIAQAHNGSGKTTCFVLSMLSRVNPQLKQPQALCVCPTRELVVQNLMVLERMGKFATDITACSTAAMADKSGEMPTSSRRPPITDQVVVGTHGTLKNWMSKRILNVRSMQILVFDEADEMLSRSGFGDDSYRMIREIRKGAPKLQILLFSATFNEVVKSFAMKIVPDANQVFVPKEDLSLDVIKQYRVRCPMLSDKTRVLKEMIFPNCEKLGQTIIFVRSREHARTLHREMERDGYKCTSIQGDMRPEDRDRVVREFRSGTTKILISTDVLSRGFDVTQVTLVINYDVPMERDGRKPAYETYLHRIGRSGRFGRKGAAFNLVTDAREERNLEDISAYFQHAIPDVPYDDEEKFLEVLFKAGLSEGI